MAAQLVSEILENLMNQLLQQFRKMVNFISCMQNLLHFLLKIASSSLGSVRGLFPEVRISG